MKISLLDYANDQCRPWRLEYALNKFLKENPKFINAVVVKEDEIDYNFTNEYNYSYCWMVELNGKFYNFILSEGGYYRRGTQGIKFKRYYPSGTMPIKRKRKSSYEYSCERTHKYVQHGSHQYRNDCQIWTLAKCLNISYDEAYTRLSARGWREDCARFTCFEKAILLSGKSFERYFSSWMNNKPFKGSIVGNIANKLPKVGTFAVCTNDHIFCVIDGVIYDSAFSAKKHVESVHQII